MAAEEGGQVPETHQSSLEEQWRPGNQEQACLPHWTGGALEMGRVSLSTWGFPEGGAVSPFTLGVLGNRNGF